MTTLAPTETTDTAASAVPGRRTLVGLALAIVLVFVVFMATGSDNESDSSLSSIKDSYDFSHTALQVTSFGGMVLCALLV
ncbi:MAG TPA: hypothetical protein PL137_17835, partial [Nocardioides sp.]|nr:hypothetical protein [Nocardioides sp.]